MRPARATYDVLILGAGASGLMCAIHAARRGRSVAVLDHAAACGRKVRVSGGGKCNFTNREAKASDYSCSNPHFVKSALAQYSPRDFLGFMERHALLVVDAGRGMLFSKNANDIAEALYLDALSFGAEFVFHATVAEVRREAGLFVIDGPDGARAASSLVVAAGGLAWPQIGASNLGYRVARSLGHKVTALRPGLAPLLAPPELLPLCASLAGISLPVRVRAPHAAEGDLLFTHRGISGPVALDASLFWREEPLTIDWLPDVAIPDALAKAPRMEIKNALATFLPKRLAAALCELHGWKGAVASLSKKQAQGVERLLHAYPFAPAGTEGYAKGEVTIGGVETAQVSSKSMQSTLVPGLYFTGEVLDVTGRLGGFNLQWAWSSGFVAGQWV